MLAHAIRHFILPLLCRAVDLSAASSRSQSVPECAAGKSVSDPDSSIQSQTPLPPLPRHFAHLDPSNPPERKPIPLRAIPLSAAMAKKRMGGHPSLHPCPPSHKALNPCKLEALPVVLETSAAAKSDLTQTTWPSRMCGRCCSVDCMTTAQQPQPASPCVGPTSLFCLGCDSLGSSRVQTWVGEGVADTSPSTLWDVPTSQLMQQQPVGAWGLDRGQQWLQPGGEGHSTFAAAKVARERTEKVAQESKTAHTSSWIGWPMQTLPRAQDTTSGPSESATMGTSPFSWPVSVPGPDGGSDSFAGWVASSASVPLPSSPEHQQNLSTINSLLDAVLDVAATAGCQQVPRPGALG